MLSDSWNRFSDRDLAADHDSPTFRHTLQLLQFTLQMETDKFARMPGKLCFSPRPNPESRFDAAFNCIVIHEASFVSDTRFQLFLSMNAILTLVLFSDIHNVQLGLCYQPSVCYKSHFCIK